jgi:hypothetical protein
MIIGMTSADFFISVCDECRMGNFFEWTEGKAGDANRYVSTIAAYCFFAFKKAGPHSEAWPKDSISFAY